MRAPKRIPGKITHCWIRPDKEWLYDQYVTQRKTARDISIKIGASAGSTILAWLREVGIPVRSRKEVDLLRRNWQNPRHYAKVALRRTGVPQICAWCGQKPDRKTGRVGEVHVHHKDHNKWNNDPSNLMYLCFTCHRAEIALWHLHQRRKAEVSCKGRTITIKFREVCNAET